VGLARALLGTTQARRQLAHDADRDFHILRHDFAERGAVDAQQAHGCARHRRGEARLVLEDRHLAEEIARPQLCQRVRTARIAHDVHRPGLDDVHLRARVALAEDRLAGPDLEKVFLGVRHPSVPCRRGSRDSDRIMRRRSGRLCASPDSAGNHGS
jgi:hypothetical protein